MDLLAKFGVDPDTLEDQFAGQVIGRVLVMDGDASAYKAASKAKRLDTAIRSFTTMIYEAMFLTKAEFARVHLTPEGCFKNGRHLLLGVKPYQANRENKAPKPPLLEPLRSVAGTLFPENHKIEVLPQMYFEADDGIMQDVYSIQNTVTWSEDKDLCIVPSPKYDIETGRILTLPEGDRYGWIAPKYTEGGVLKLGGHGTKMFWAQMLCGDTADNVKGILKLDGANCGISTALQVLDGIDSEPHAANLVINGYREINQNPLPEAEALWLTRSIGDNAAGYIWSLDLTERNRAFIQDCFNRKWRMTPDEYREKFGDLV